MRYQPTDDDQLVHDVGRIFDLALPTELSGTDVLPLPDREERWVRLLFERAVGGFYEVTPSRQGWQVRTGEWLHWQIEHRTANVDNILPKMKTDVILEHGASNRRIVIDTKFTSILTRGWYRGETLRSDHLFQIYAYLRSQAGRGDPAADRVEGLLLHPSVGGNVDETAVIQGHPIRYPDRLEITSYPGPVPGIEVRHLQPDANVPAVPARNRRIGELLKELGLAEGRLTGLPKVFRAMTGNGSPAPRFDFDEQRTYFRAALPAHPEYTAIAELRDAAHLRALGENQDAFRRTESGWRSNPASAVLATEMIRLHVERGKPESAERCSTSSGSRAPGTPCRT